MLQLGLQSLWVEPAKALGTIGWRVLVEGVRAIALLLGILLLIGLLNLSSNLNVKIEIVLYLLDRVTCVVRIGVLHLALSFFYLF